MAVTRLLLAAATARQRHLALDDAMEAVSASGGWVEDVNLFSNVSAVVTAWIRRRDLAGFADRLAAARVGLAPADRDALARTAADPPPDEEVRCTLQITFVHDEPDLRRDVPAVPG